MSQRPKPLPQIMGIIPYAPGEAPPKVDGPTYKLASNENPLGASPKAMEAYKAQADRLWVYPDGAVAELRRAIGKRHGLDPARIICGAGSDEIFQLLGRAYLAPGDEIIATRHAFAIYALVGQQSGATVVEVAETNLTADVDAMLAAVTPRTKIVWLANPNNPTGTYLPFEEVKRLHAGLPSNVLLVLDGAYAEYVRRNDYASGVELASQFDNVIMTRTFSKIYGLAALRLGWAYAPEHVIAALDRVRGPFNVTGPAQAAGIAAIEDEDFVRRSAEFNEGELRRLTEGVRALGLDVVDSVGNFALVRFPQTPGRTAADAFAYLRDRGVTARGMAGYKLPDYLRISVGTVEGNNAVIARLRDFLAGR